MSAVDGVNSSSAIYDSEEEHNGTLPVQGKKRKISESPPPVAADVTQVASIAVLAPPSLSDAFSSLMVTDDEVLMIDRRLRTRANLSVEEISQMYKVLFEGNNFAEFIVVHGNDEDAKNIQFELFLKIIDADRINDLPGAVKEKFYEFAFSYARFNWIQMQNDEVDGRLVSELLAFEHQYRQETMIGDISRFKSRGGRRADAWMHQRMAGSSTISLPSSKQRLADRNWRAADDKISLKAEQKGRVSFAIVQIVHKILTNREEGVDSPGEVRTETARSSMAVELYPPAPGLDERAESYGRWLDGEVRECEAGRKSSILTASQAYQRLVSVHPFENGNGRISRFMMDYVLYRTGLPPAILGNKVLDAVFVLKPKTIEGNQQFVHKIYTGVRASYGYIYPNHPLS